MFSQSQILLSSEEPPMPEKPWGSPDSSARQVFKQPRRLNERRTTEADFSAYLSEIESSRENLERYARELSRLAEHSAEAVQQAQVAAARKGDLLATMSHELRTPLNGILGMVGLLMARSLDSVDREYVNVIKQSGETLLSLIDEVLDYSKIEAGKLELEQKEFDLRQTVEDAMRIIQIAAERKGLRLVAAIEEDCPLALEGDALRLRQILLNLLSNAIKFSEGGEISLRVQLMNSAAGEHTLRFTVRDEGMGISEEQLACLFEPFTQANRSIAGQFGGTGLGLAICKRLAEMMGGTIGATSEQGVGSSFWFTIRAARGSTTLAVVQPKKELRSLAAPNTARILLVEDNVVNQKVGILMLKKLGFAATLVENGAQAVQAAAEETYDLIFMDCLMPEMDGFEATRAIRESSNGGFQVPIVAMTANAFSSDRDACFAAGMNDYLPKPVREADLKAVLDRWLQAEAQQVEAAIA